MCCFFTSLVLLGPRVAAVVWWLLDQARWVGNLPRSAFNSLVWPILGIIFLPWTTLVYVFVYPMDNFWNWLFLILAIIVDLGSHGGGFFGNRDRIGM